MALSDKRVKELELGFVFAGIEQWRRNLSGDTISERKEAWLTNVSYQNPSYDPSTRELLENSMALFRPARRCPGAARDDRRLHVRQPGADARRDVPALAGDVDRRLRALVGGRPAGVADEPRLELPARRHLAGDARAARPRRAARADLQRLRQLQAGAARRCLRAGDGAGGVPGQVLARLRGHQPLERLRGSPARLPYRRRRARSWHGEAQARPAG